jgi:hypothetical protein
MERTLPSPWDLGVAYWRKYSCRGKSPNEGSWEFEERNEQQKVLRRLLGYNLGEEKWQNHPFTAEVVIVSTDEVQFTLRLLTSICVAKRLV